MKRIVLLMALTAALLVSAACSSTAPTNTNKPANANASPASTPAASPASNTGAATQGAQDFTLHNKTGLVLNKVFVSPHDEADWQEDVLGQDVLADDASVEIKFNRDEKAALWDLKVEDTAGNAVMWPNLNLLEISEVTIRNDGGKATAEVK